MDNDDGISELKCDEWRVCNAGRHSKIYERLL